jgi:phosphoribosyl 1,2-cyclic phosphate phosphodiesterase
MIGCSCAVCTSADPRNKRTRTSVHVVMDGLHVQVDAAPEFRLQCLREGVDRLDLFILTHGHSDHIAGMDDLRRFCDLRGGQALPVYTTEEGMAGCCAIYPLRDHGAAGSSAATPPSGSPRCRPSWSCPRERSLDAPAPRGGRDDRPGLHRAEQRQRVRLLHRLQAPAGEAVEPWRGARRGDPGRAAAAAAPDHMSIDEAIEAGKGLGAGGLAHPPDAPDGPRLRGGRLPEGFGSPTTGSGSDYRGPRCPTRHAPVRQHGRLAGLVAACPAGPFAAGAAAARPARPRRLRPPSGPRRASRSAGADRARGLTPGELSAPMRSR